MREAAICQKCLLSLPAPDGLYDMWQVFVDRKGRTLDLALCLIQANSVLLLVSPSRRKVLLSRLDQYIFFGDKVLPPSGLLPPCVQSEAASAACPVHQLACDGGLTRHGCLRHRWRYRMSHRTQCSSGWQVPAATA